MTGRITALALLLLDMISAVVVFNVISYARGIPGADHIAIVPLTAPILAFVAAVYLVQGYRGRTDMLSVDYASQHVIATIGAMLATLLLTFVLIPAGYELQSSRAVIALSFLALIPLTLSYRRLFYLRTLADHGKRAVVFVGDDENSHAFQIECEKMGMTQPLVYTLADRPIESFADTSKPPLDKRALVDVLDEIQSGKLTVEAIVLRESARELPADISQRLVQLYFAGVPTFTLELFHEVYWQKIPLYRLNQTWLFQEGFQIAREPVFERAKRAADVILACLGLLMALPLMVVAAVAIWLDDRGPLFFRQNRIGKNHVPFPLIKLRTMRTGSAAEGLYTQKDDPRITRVGNFLRTTRLDELPQLWNVLRGDMSLIGPRAEWDKLVEEYETLIPCYHFRHLVKPGITGWAQVNYPYGASVADTLRKLEYDLYYIRHFSFRLDATIVLKTIHIMLFGKGR